MILDHLPGRNFHYQGQEWLYFSGTSYLGFAQHPKFLQYLQEGFQRYGANFGGSRRSNMQLGIFEEAEQYLAEWLQVPAVLTLSSGSLAGQLLVRYLTTLGDCYYAPTIHPALSSGQHPFKGSYEDWTHYILNLKRDQDQPIFLLSSTLNALYGKSYTFEWLMDLPDPQYFRLVLDDSHGLGVLGPHGRGVNSLLPENLQIPVITTGSTGKALGIPGGLIAGSTEIIQQLWESPFFGGASPIIPAYLYAMLQSKSLLKEQQLKLKNNIQYFVAALGDKGIFENIPGHPVFYLKKSGLAEHLKEKHILVSSFPYPSPTDPLVSRIVLNALHTRTDLEKLITFILAYIESP